MAKGGDDEYKDQLSVLKERIDIEKGVVISRFGGLREMLNKKESETLEHLDNIYTDTSEALGESMRDYGKLRAVMILLEERMSDGSSLCDCFIRKDSEIEKRKPKWKSPIVEVRWNIQQLYKLTDDMCHIDVYSSTGDYKVSARRATSMTTFSHLKSEESPESPREKTSSLAEEKARRGLEDREDREPQVFTSDVIPPRGGTQISGEKQSVRLEWKKQQPTLNREIQYLDNENGTFGLDWNGESFNSNTVELSVGEHFGTLSLGDCEQLPSVDPFSVEATTGVLEVMLRTSL